MRAGLPKMYPKDQEAEVIPVATAMSRTRMDFMQSSTEGFGFTTGNFGSLYGMVC